jgi:hypothetical protein
MKEGRTILSTSTSHAGCRIADGVCLLTSVQRDMDCWNALLEGSSSISASLESDDCRLPASCCAESGGAAIALTLESGWLFREG